METDLRRHWKLIADSQTVDSVTLTGTHTIAAPQDQWMGALQTLELSMAEVVHIRSVLTRAELDALPLDNNLKVLHCVPPQCAVLCCRRMWRRDGSASFA